MALQFRVLQSAIEFIKTTANQEPQKLSSSVNAPNSPHYAIYQKRKSIAGECLKVTQRQQSDLHYFSDPERRGGTDHRVFSSISLLHTHLSLY